MTQDMRWEMKFWWIKEKKYKINKLQVTTYIARLHHKPQGWIWNLHHISYNKSYTDYFLGKNL